MRPSQAITRLDLSLSYSEFSLRANRKGFVGLKVLPAIGVALNAADFIKIKVESLLTKPEETKRAPRGTYSRGTYEFDKDSYKTDEHGAEETVDDAEIEIYGDMLPAERYATDRAINRVLQAYEQAAADAVMNTSTWTGSSLTTAVSTPWSTAASAVPITDIDAAIEKVKSNCGIKPNTLILTDYALRKIKRTAQITDLLKYSGQDDPKNLGVLEGLKELFALESIIVADGFKNSSDEGQTASFSRLWPIDKAMVAHVSTSQDLQSEEPRIGATIMFGEQNVSIPGADSSEMGLIVEEYREENRRGGVIRARGNYQVKIMHVKAGHLLTNVAA